LELRKPFTDKPIQIWEIGDDIVPGNAIQISASNELDKETYEFNTVKWLDKFTAFLENPACREVDTLLVEFWLEENEDEEAIAIEVMEALVAANEKLSELRHLFFGWAEMESNHITFTFQTDLSPIFEAYPQLETVYVGGGENLRLGSPTLPNLKTLVVAAEDIAREVIQGLTRAKLPELRHLELWLGDTSYYYEEEIAVLRPLFSEQLFPKLEYLGLRNSSSTDEIAIALSGKRFMEKLKVLDLSPGSLTDRGGDVLLFSLYVNNLEELILADNELSPRMASHFENLSPKVDVSGNNGKEDPEVARYSAAYE
jgi:hypothetical protein